jgi:hypothetical protein
LVWTIRLNGCKQNLERRSRCKRRNRWEDEVRNGGRVGGEECQYKVYNRGMEEAPENYKEPSHSGQGNGSNKGMNATCT